MDSFKNPLSLIKLNLLIKENMVYFKKNNNKLNFFFKKHNCINFNLK